jgi:hypothetical protein
LYQISIEIRSTSFNAAKPIFTIYGKALSRRCEAKESALIRALFFIDENLGKDWRCYSIKYLLL